MVNRELLSAAALFTAASAFGAVVSVREDVVGEPLGVHVPGRVRTHLAVGLGSGLSAPWPMPVATLVAGIAARPGSRWPGAGCVVIGCAVLLGTAVEPATWGRRSRTRLIGASVALNAVSGSALVIAGRRFRRTA